MWKRLTAGIGTVTRKVCNDALVTSLLGGCGARCRSGTFASVVWDAGRLLCGVTLVYVPGKQIAPGKLVSAMLAFIRSIPSVCVFCFVFRMRLEESE